MPKPSSGKDLYASERNFSSKLDIVCSEFHKLGSAKEVLVDWLAAEGPAATSSEREESLRKLSTCLYNEAIKQMISKSKRRGFVRDAGQKKFMKHVNRSSQLKDRATVEQHQLKAYCSAAVDPKQRFQNKLFFWLLSSLPDAASKARLLQFYLSSQQPPLSGDSLAPGQLLSSKYLLGEVWDSLGIIYCSVDFPS